MGIEVRSHDEEKPEKQLPIELVELDELVPHEMTIDHELERFIEKVQESGKVYWALLVDEESKLILDGHHRTAGLKKLDYKYVPAHLIDYHDDDLVSLDTWYPKVSATPAEVIEVLKKQNLEIIQTDNVDIDKLYQRKLTAYVSNGKTMYEVKGEREDIFQQVREYWLEDIIYYDNPNLCLEDVDENHTAILGWPYTKDEILEHVKEGKVHLPKTTRHELAFEVPKCNYPLDELQ